MHKQFEASASGSKADIQSGVDISKVHGGYFSNLKNAQDFCDVGIAPIEKSLPVEMSYMDFGGGQGFLGRLVKEYLEGCGHTVTELIVDANPSYLDVASKTGLHTKMENLETGVFDAVDLITIRAVLHYNLPEAQLAILKNVRQSLREGGFFVHQLSAARSLANNELRSALVNIPSLGRDGSGSYNWISESDAMQLHLAAGFSNATVVGHASSGSWGPESQWTRFNENLEKAATTPEEIQTLLERKTLYISQANAMIEEYVQRYGNEETGVEKLADGSYLVHYEYPIIVSKR